MLIKKFSGVYLSTWSTSPNLPLYYVFASHQAGITSEEGTTNEGQSQLTKSTLFISDIQEGTYNSNCHTSIELDVNPKSLLWVPPYDAKYKDGIIAMGDASGNMYLWNASEIMGKKGKESDIADALISSKIYNDNVPILSIDSNPIVKSNIAFGGSEVRVISTEKDESYSFKGNESKISYTSVKWNKKVPNILASTNDMGIVNIWDLKTKKSIFNIQSIDGYDPFNAEKPNKSLCITWNPEKNTQIAVANDDDETPVVNIWELRNLNSPLATFKGIHKKGIKGITWYDSEPSYFVTVGKDHLAIVWDYKQATPAYEIQLGCSANSVQFIPQMYSHFVATSTDGDMEIMSMVHPMKCLAADYVSKPFSWKSKKCVGRFGFGGNFASVNGKNLTYAKVIMNDKIVENANKFEQVMECSDRHIEKIIETSSDILSPQDVKELQLMKAVRSQSKEEIFQLLGIDKVKIKQETDSYLNRRKQSIPNQQVSEENEKDDLDFFNNVITKTDAKEDYQSSMGAKPTEGTNENSKTEVISRNTNWNEGAEKLIKGNLMGGDLESAIDCAMKCGRVPEALIIAMVAGNNTLEATVQSYLNKQNDTYIKGVLSKLYSKQFAQINDPMSTWKETAAYIISYNPKYQNEISKLAEELANKKGDLDSAILCAIIAENAELTIKYWISKYNSIKSTLTIYQRYLAYQILFEKIVLFKMFVQSFDSSKEADFIMSFYCKILAELHMKDIAMKYSELISNTQYSSIIKNRISQSDFNLSKRYSSNLPFHVTPLEVQREDIPDKIPKQVPIPKPNVGKPFPQPFVNPIPTPQELPEESKKSIPDEPKKAADKKAKPVPPKPVIFMPNKVHTEPKEVINKASLPKAPSFPTRDSGGKLRESGGVKSIQAEEAKGNPFNNLPPPPKPVVKPPVEQPYIPANLGLNPNFGLSKLEKKETADQKGTLEDTPEQLKPIAIFLNKITSEMMYMEDTPAKKKDIETRLQKLFGKMASNSLSPDAIKKLHSIVETLSAGNIDIAKKVSMQLAQDNWNEGPEWIQLIKRIVTYKEKKQ